MTAAEWKPYGCELPAPKIGNTRRLGSIFHVTHASTAKRILEDGQIARGLVFDASKLNITRRTVVWVSPNQWAHGSRYGTVEFEFDWKTLSAGKTLYWVETMTAYTPTAFRFFLTAGDVKGLPPLQKYDPAHDDGPLRFHDNEWWWNSSYCGEVMIDDDLSLEACSAIRFTKHHPTFCNIGHAQCTELGKDGDRSSAIVMAYLLTTGRETANHAFKDKKGRLSVSAEASLSSIGVTLGALNKLKGPINDQTVATDVVRGALAQVASGRLKEAKRLTSLLGSATLLWTVLQSLTVEQFDIGSREIALALEP